MAFFPLNIQRESVDFQDQQNQIKIYDLLKIHDTVINTVKITPKNEEWNCPEG